MEKNRQTVRVVDEHGTVIGYTYPKRAKGLVKKCRAEFVTDQEIRLYKERPTYENMEENEMDECKKINYLTINPRDWYPDMEDPNTRDGAMNGNRTQGSIAWDRFIMDNPLAEVVDTAPRMVEVLSVGTFDWHRLTRVAVVLELAPDTEYQLVFWLNGGENDRSDETCNLELLYLTEDKSQYTNRLCYRLNRSYIKPLKKYKGWEYYMLPFSTDSTGFIKLRLVADRAPMAVMAAEAPEVYADLQDEPDVFAGQRPQRHNIIFEDGWPTDKWYATKALTGEGLSSTPKGQLQQNEEAGQEDFDERMDDLEDTIEELGDHVEDLHESMSDLSDKLVALMERFGELSDSLAQK